MHELLSSMTHSMSGKKDREVQPYIPSIIYNIQCLLYKGSMKCEAQQATTYLVTALSTQTTVVSEAVWLAKYTQLMTTIYNAYFAARSEHIAERREGVRPRKSMQDIH